MSRHSRPSLSLCGISPQETLPYPTLSRSSTAIIGTGNLAWHLAAVLPGEVAVIARRILPETEAWPVPLIGFDALRAMQPGVVFLAVPDNQIEVISLRLAGLLPADTFVFHTSGATPVGRINDFFTHRGALWPIRSLRKGEVVTDWRDLPLVIYGSDPVSAAHLRELGHHLSDTVEWLDDEQRSQLHLAAVFSNNFVSALYEVAHQLCAEHGIPFELLLPIIRNTAGREDGTSPASRQTGAAARGDTATMDRHLSLLTSPDYRKLYRDLSDLILQNRLAQNDPHLRSDADDDL